MADYLLGADLGTGGPYYLHFRPYHLCDLETPQSVAEAGIGAGAVAKRPTSRGDIITEGDVAVDESTFVARLPGQQDTLSGSEAG